MLTKATSGKKTTATAKRTNQINFNLKPSHLPLDLQVQARQIFFAYYISDFCQAWHFLYPHFDASTAPEHVSLSIDAASLAFLSHHMTSPSAQSLGRQKYVSALRKTNKVLRDPIEVQRTSTLDTTLLLDLFEKITGPEITSVVSQRAHIDGALALVKLRGLQQFSDPGGLKALTRLSLNAVVISISLGDSIPRGIFEIRQHMAQFVDISNPKWKLTGITLEITELVSDIAKNLLTAEEKVKRCVDYENQLRILDREAPPSWSYERMYTGEVPNDTTLDGFYDTYASRMDTQMWNVLRFMRLTLCDEIIDSCSHMQGEASKRAYETAALVVQEICATVPQMTDCNGPARTKLPAESRTSSHTHTLSHYLDTYILLFGLYAAAWSRGCPPRAKVWIVEQLDRIADHLGVKEAATIAELLKIQGERARVGLWQVYRLIGSYAFAA